MPFVKSGEALPRITAEILYTGSGRLIGRWEIVKPGEAAPVQRDLLPESSLPIEERGTRRRFTPVKRFNMFLPPTGRITIPGPDSERIEKTVDGMYLLLFRVESVMDGLNQSSVKSANAGQGTVDSGGAAGFAMPVMRYYVGIGGAQVDQFNAADYQLAPRDLAEDSAAQPIVFTWPTVPQAKYYRLIVEDAAGAEVFSAILLRDTRSYHAPSWLLRDAPTDLLRWRVAAADANTSFCSRENLETYRPPQRLMTKIQIWSAVKGFKT
ncbi:MAG TPA: hypothetical protein VMS31_13380 [Pyrinomonadaceae bacterium]|nr:hypothetical protein [Pyrinomonadaceae bacterium]